MTKLQLTVISGDANDNNYGNLGGGRPIAVGDIDNDGLEDMLIGSPFADGVTENIWSSGQVMVVFGRNQTHPGTIYDQAKKNYDEINLVIHGSGQNDLLGYATACGDIDGDGYDDMILAAPWGDSKNNNRVNAGEIYVIYGRPRNQFGTEINLRSTAPDLIILGAYGGTGWLNYDSAGFSLAVANVVGDSREDILIGAVYAKPSGRFAAGIVYVIEGNTRGNLGTEIDLRTGGDVRIFGQKAGDLAGCSVAAGDVNGDGRDDIIIGSYGVDVYGTRSNAGAAFVVYGSQSLSATIDLNDSADLSIYGSNVDDYLGYKVAVGNINGDSYDDIIVNVLYGDGPNNALPSCGEVNIIYGSSTLPAIKDTLSNEQDIIIYGKDRGDLFGYSIASGNVNNDQFDDILIGAIWGDGEFNSISNAGEAFLILGNTTANLGSNINPSVKSRTIFYGLDSGDISGRFVQFGDLDGDSNDDVIIGTSGADGPDNARDLVGEFWVIYGAPPPVKNEYLTLLDGDIDSTTILSNYKPYTFRVNTSNILDYRDSKFVTLIINPLEYNIGFRWSRSTDKFTQVSGPTDLVECISTGADAVHDGFYNYTIDFKLIFNWNFTKKYPINCKVLTECTKSLPDEDDYPNVFKVNNKLNFKGALNVSGSVQGSLSDNDWVL
jgi:hypothetical protein